MAIVLWGDAAAAGDDPEADARNGDEAARLRQLPRSGRRSVPESPATAAEGLEAVYPFDPTRDDPAWLGFQKRFDAAYHASDRRCSPRWPSTP